MKNILYSIELGNQLSILSGQISFFEITNTIPKIIDSPFQICNSNGDIPLSINEAFCYAILEIETYSLNGSNENAGDKKLQLLSIFPKFAQKIVFSEQITIANTFCFAQLISVNNRENLQISGTERECFIASKMRDNFVNVTGKISKVIQLSPNGLETNSYGMFNSLANLVYYGITNDTIYQNLLQLTRTNTLLQSIFNIARNPFNEVENIYNLISNEAQIYSPALSELDLSSVPNTPSPIPNQWTLTIKVNDSGSKNFLIGGTGYIVFDKNDRAWVSNNVRQGTGNSSTFCTVLECDGSPAEFSPVFGNDLLGGGFGIVPNAEGDQIFIGNFGWGSNEFLPQFGSISVFNSDGSAVKQPPSFKEAVTRPQGIAFDSDGNLWATSWGSQIPLPALPNTDNAYQYESTNSAIVCFIKDRNWFPVRFEFSPQSPNYQPFDIAIDSSDNVFLTTGGHKVLKDPSQDINSSVWKFQLDLSNEIPKINNSARYDFQDVEFCKEVIVNQENEILVVAQTSNQITKLDNDLTRVLDVYSKNIYKPWGICEDGDGNLFVANFSNNDSQDQSVEDSGPFGVSVIKKEDNSTIKLMTLPSGGKEVRLATGMPLYGNVNPKPCYQPLMRMTCNVTDKVGNLWVTNNWKPSFPNDVLENPGGDGVVIFVGVAKPK